MQDTYGYNRNEYISYDDISSIEKTLAETGDYKEQDLVKTSGIGRDDIVFAAQRLREILEMNDRQWIVGEKIVNTKEEVIALLGLKMAEVMTKEDLALLYVLQHSSLGDKVMIAGDEELLSAYDGDADKFMRFDVMLAGKEDTEHAVHVPVIHDIRHFNGVIYAIKPIQRKEAYKDIPDIKEWQSARFSRIYEEAGKRLALEKKEIDHRLLLNDWTKADFTETDMEDAIEKVKREVREHGMLQSIMDLAARMRYEMTRETKAMLFALRYGNGSLYGKEILFNEAYMHSEYARIYGKAMDMGLEFEGSQPDAKEITVTRIPDIRTFTGSMLTHKEERQPDGSTKRISENSVYYNAGYRDGFRESRDICDLQRVSEWTKDRQMGNLDEIYAGTGKIPTVNFTKSEIEQAAKKVKEMIGNECETDRMIRAAANIGLGLRASPDNKELNAMLYVMQQVMPEIMEDGDCRRVMPDAETLWQSALKDDGQPMEYGIEISFAGIDDGVMTIWKGMIRDVREGSDVFRLQTWKEDPDMEGGFRLVEDTCMHSSGLVMAYANALAEEERAE